MSTTEGPRPRLAIVGMGFIGRRVAEAALARDWEVSGLDLHPQEQDGVRLVTGSADDPEALARLAEGATHVVFAAGSTKPAESDEDPVTYAARNLTPLLACLDATAAAGARGFTFLSSGGTVYGPDAPVPTPENAPLWPISSYGIMKAAAEQYVAMHARHDGFTADILRCANVFGPGEPTAGSQGLIGIARARMRAGLPVAMFGDGGARRDYLHVDDLAGVILSLADRPDGVRVLNVGSGRSISIAEIITALATALGVEPVVERLPARDSDSPVAELDISKLRTVLDFEPRDTAEWLAVTEPA